MDKKNKKELVKKYAKSQKDEFNNSLPFIKDLFEELFGYLDETLETYGCDDTLKYTIEFLNKNELPLENSIEWLNENGGFCDCEVLANIEDKVLD